MTVRKPIVIVDGEKRELPAGDTLHGVKHIRYYDVYTDSQGVWSIDYSADFSAVDFVMPVAIDSSQDISEQKIASLQSYGGSAAQGMVVESNSLVIGSEALANGGPNVLVRVRVEGVLP